jgi:hypothetical protein
VNSALGDFSYDITIGGPVKGRAFAAIPPSGGVLVPAEVSKRGVMIRNFEGALSSRRKRAAIIIARRIKKSRQKRKKIKNAGCLLNSRRGGK